MLLESIAGLSLFTVGLILTGVFGVKMIHSDAYNINQGNTKKLLGLIETKMEECNEELNQEEYRKLSKLRTELIRVLNI
jgi:hypothetical protein